MGLVKSNTALYTTTISDKDTVDKYYRVFKAQVDTIEARSGNPRYRQVLYCSHFDVYTKKK